MQKNKQLRTFLFALLATAIAAPVIPLVGYLGRPELERPSFFVAATLVVTIEVCRELRGRIWFWITMAVIAASHIPLVVLIPWRPGWIPAPIILLVCVVDFALMLAVIGFIEKAVNRLSVSPSSSSGICPKM